MSHHDGVQESAVGDTGVPDPTQNSEAEAAVHYCTCAA